MSVEHRICHAAMRVRVESCRGNYLFSFAFLEKWLLLALAVLAPVLAVCCRLVAIDHLTSDVYLVALHDGASPAKDMANAWLDSTSNSLHDLAAAERVNAGQTLTPGRLDCMQQPLGDESVPGAAQDHTTGCFPTAHRNSGMFYGTPVASILDQLKASVKVWHAEM